MVIVVGKLTRNRVLCGGAGLCRALRGGDGARNFPHHVGRGGDGAGKIHVGQGRRPHNLASDHAIAIPTQYQPKHLKKPQYSWYRNCIALCFIWYI